MTGRQAEMIASHICEAQRLISHLQFMIHASQTAEAGYPVLLSCEDYIFTDETAIQNLSEGTFHMVSLFGWPEDQDNPISRKFGSPPRAKFMAMAHQAGWDLSAHAFDEAMLEDALDFFWTIDYRYDMEARQEAFLDLRERLCGDAPVTGWGKELPVNTFTLLEIPEPWNTQWDFVRVEEDDDLARFAAYLKDQFIPALAGSIGSHARLAGASGGVADLTGLRDMALLSRQATALLSHLDAQWRTIDGQTREAAACADIDHCPRPPTATRHLYPDRSNLDKEIPGPFTGPYPGAAAASPQPALPQNDKPSKPKVAQELIDGMRKFLTEHRGRNFAAKDLDKLLQESKLTSRSYTAADYSKAKAYLAQAEKMPLLGRGYEYRIIKKKPR